MYPLRGHPDHMLIFLIVFTACKESSVRLPGASGLVNLVHNLPSLSIFTGCTLRPKKPVPATQTKLA